jgi:hypothetical protein
MGAKAEEKNARPFSGCRFSAPSGLRPTFAAALQAGLRALGSPPVRLIRTK